MEGKNMVEMVDYLSKRKPESTTGATETTTRATETTKSIVVVILIIIP